LFNLLFPDFPQREIAQIQPWIETCIVQCGEDLGGRLEVLLHVGNENLAR
jgi:hypothetical protein